MIRPNPTLEFFDSARRITWKIYGLIYHRSHKIARIKLEAGQQAFLKKLFDDQFRWTDTKGIMYERSFNYYVKAQNSCIAKHEGVEQ